MSEEIITRIIRNMTEAVEAHQESLEIKAELERLESKFKDAENREFFCEREAEMLINNETHMSIAWDIFYNENETALRTYLKNNVDFSGDIE